MTGFRRQRPREAELAALADGSLPPGRRAELESLVADSPEFAQRLGEQERAVAFARNAAAAVSAPEHLRARIEASRPERSPRRFLLVGAAAAATAAAIALAFIVSGSGTSAEQFRAALRAPSGGTVGAATLTRTQSGWRIELHAPALPRLADGSFYEAWLRNRAGVLVPIGTFNSGKKVTLWAGVSPAAFPTLTVTRERADGDQASSGRKVLVGTAEPTG
jgi:anti-sigma factor RsiW